MKREDYLWIRDTIADIAGIHLDEHKVPMITSRLDRRLRHLGLTDYSQYVKHLTDKKNAGELEVFVNSLTTNKTDFFREPDHFVHLKNDFLEEYVKSNKGKTLYTWSAACSNGAEVYTLAMVYEEFRQYYPELRYKILGSDIDTNVLRQAEDGVYDFSVLKDIYPQYIQRYFVRDKTNIKNYIVTDELKRNIKIRYFNLVEINKSIPLKFDVVFLRNVLIYFKTETIQKVIDKLYQQMNVGGLLFIGHSETLNNIRHKFSNIGSAIFKK